MLPWTEDAIAQWAEIVEQRIHVSTQKSICAARRSCIGKPTHPDRALRLPGAAGRGRAAGIRSRVSHCLRPFHSQSSFPTSLIPARAAPLRPLDGARARAHPPVRRSTISHALGWSCPADDAARPPAPLQVAEEHFRHRGTRTSVSSSRPRLLRWISRPQDLAPSRSRTSENWHPLEADTQHTQYNPHAPEMRLLQDPEQGCKAVVQYRRRQLPRTVYSQAGHG